MGGYYGQQDHELGRFIGETVRRETVEMHNRFAPEEASLDEEREPGPEADAKLKREMEKLAKGAGKVVLAKYRGGGDWQVVFDTEYAALKVHYAHRKDPKIRMGKSPNIGGYYVSRIR
jgi:hypothetical protein